jgi:hypothetical protein
LYANLTNAEGYDPGVTAFNTDGFNAIGVNGYSMVSWQWKQSPTSGFNIVPYTGTGAGTPQSITHNLGVAPKFIITKRRNSTSNWWIYHSGIQAAYPGEWMYMNLNYLHQSTANATDAPYYKTVPSSSTFTVAGDGANILNATYVSYLWAEVPGFSKFDSYTGNGAADGPFVYTGFRPKYVVIKSLAAGSWKIHDIARNTTNPQGDILYYQVANAEATADAYIDSVSNGFKIRDTNGDQNTSGGTYIYMAFAESPFGLNNRAR